MRCAHIADWFSKYVLEEVDWQLLGSHKEWVKVYVGGCTNHRRLPPETTVPNSDVKRSWVWLKSHIVKRNQYVSVYINPNISQTLTKFLNIIITIE